MATAILGFVDDQAARDEAIDRTAALVAGMSWEGDAPVYLAMLRSLMRDR